LSFFPNKFSILIIVLQSSPPVTELEVLGSSVRSPSGVHGIFCAH